MYKKSKTLSREWLSNPYSDLPLLKRLEKNGSVNLIQNNKVTDFGNGYDMIEPINSEKRFKGKDKSI
ncbi:hypothetical protein [Paenibacillus puerhi]|uniref:hypothetical protein n=1 Tax=Paenibacillus puerhi TaxID=2692622 RepID=UPI00135C3471|nr:hypothetical protein [Paenibacillus puerhi]